MAFSYTRTFQAKCLIICVIKHDAFGMFILEEKQMPDLGLKAPASLLNASITMGLKIHT